MWVGRCCLCLSSCALAWTVLQWTFSQQASSFRIELPCSRPCHLSSLRTYCKVGRVMAFATAAENEFASVAVSETRRKLLSVKSKATNPEAEVRVLQTKHDKPLRHVLHLTHHEEGVYNLAKLDAGTAIEYSLVSSATAESGWFPSLSRESPDSLLRSAQVAAIVWKCLVRPLLKSLMVRGLPNNWDEFWARPSLEANVKFGLVNSNTADAPDVTSVMTNADCVTATMELLGPTYVKFGQALSSRTDLLPSSLIESLSRLQDRMEPFDDMIAKEIIATEFKSIVAASKSLDSSSQLSNMDPNVALQFLLESLHGEPPKAAASIGQVYKGYLPGYGPVAVKVQRPGIHHLVMQDTAMLRSIATWVESISLPTILSVHPTGSGSQPLIATKVVAAVQEFMTRIMEELDYRNEAANMETFASLYCYQRGSSDTVQVVVPKVYREFCTPQILVMEWIEGIKLNDVDPSHSTALQEHLALIQSGMKSTLSQLLDTGKVHADPHPGNLLKVRTDHNETRLGYLDFGLLATVPEQVRDGLVCAVAQLIFARNTPAVASLFGELHLMPPTVIEDPIEQRELGAALTKALSDVLVYENEKDRNNEQGADKATTIPTLRFDKLLGALSTLVSRFQFTLPPYFLNIARALATLEGLARSLDPKFNSLNVVYPYAIQRLFRNPSMSPVVEATLLDLTRSSTTGQLSIKKCWQLLNDVASMTGQTRLHILCDVLSTVGGRGFIKRVSKEIVLQSFGFPGRRWKRQRTKGYGRRSFMKTFLRL